MKINQIYSGDAVATLKSFPDNCVDLVVTSPPYDNLRSYGGFDFKFENMAVELFRVIKQGGVCVWVVGDQVINGSETGTSFRQALYFKELGFNLHDTMIYEKTPSYPSSQNSVRYSQSFEFMFIFSKGLPKSVNLIQDRKNKWGGRSSWGKQSERLKNGELKPRDVIEVKELGIRFNIWNFPTGKGQSTKDKIAFNHPAIFPEALARDHILSWSQPGDLVLDPMCGSGTTCKMAKLNKRNYIGIEINPEYVKIAQQRLLNTMESLI